MMNVSKCWCTDTNNHLSSLLVSTLRRGASRWRWTGLFDPDRCWTQCWAPSVSLRLIQRAPQTIWKVLLFWSSFLLSALVCFLPLTAAVARQHFTPTCVFLHQNNIQWSEKRHKHTVYTDRGITVWIPYERASLFTGSTANYLNSKSTFIISVRKNNSDDNILLINALPTA